MRRTHKGRAYGSTLKAGAEYRPITDRPDKTGLQRGRNCNALDDICHFVGSVVTRYSNLLHTLRIYSSSADHCRGRSSDWADSRQKGHLTRGADRGAGRIQATVKVS